MQTKFGGRRALVALCAALGLGCGANRAGAAPWWRDAVFYEVFVRSFADAAEGPLAGDGIGDLQGLIEHLDYLNDGRGAAGHSLGVTALWLMPVQPSPSYHGYDVTDYFAVNPQYGDAALFRRFVAEAHRRGMHVIVDLVLNHASSRHPWFERALAAPAGSEARARFRFSPLPEQIAGPWDQRVWHPGGGDFYYGVFSAEMPDWNFRSRAVTEHHRRVAEFWLREMGVDGFRLDAVRYFFESGEALQDTAETRAWLKGFTDYCHELKAGAFVIGEDTARMPEVAQAIRGGSLDSAFEFDLARATLEAIRLETGGILTEALGWLDALYAGDSPWATIVDNHDQERVRTQLDDDEGKARLAAKLLFTLPGVPFVYYGEELGMRGAKPDPELRPPMPWTADAPNAGFTRAAVKPWHAPRGDFGTINVAGEAADPQSLLALYRKLIRLRATSPALRHGRPVGITADDKRVHVSLRATDEETVLVIANVTGAPRRGPKLSATLSPVRNGENAQEEIEGAAVAPVAVAAEGGFQAWAPFAELPAHAVRVVRWAKAKR